MVIDFCFIMTSEVNQTVKISYIEVSDIKTYTLLNVWYIIYHKESFCFSVFSIKLSKMKLGRLIPVFLIFFSLHRVDPAVTQTCKL